MSTELQVPEVMHFENLTGNNPTQETIHADPPPAEPKAPAAPPPAPAAQDAPPAVPERTQREIAMEAIALARRKAIEKELRQGEDMADQARAEAGLQPMSRAARAAPAVVDEGVDPAAPAPVVEAQPAPAAPAAPAAQQQLPVADQIVQIGNQQYKVTPYQLQQLASVGMVALNAMQRQQQQPQQPQQQAPAQPQQQAQPPAAPKSILTPEESRQFAQRIQYGNEAEGGAALQDMTMAIANRLAAANPQVDPRAVVQYATQQAVQQIRQEQQLNYNLNVIGSEYPDIFNNEGRAQLAALKLHSVRQRDQLYGI